MLTNNPDILLLPDNISVQSLLLDTIQNWAPSVILLPLDDSDLPLQGEHALLALLKDYPVASTIDHGWVRISTDGHQLWAQGEYGSDNKD